MSGWKKQSSGGSGTVGPQGPQGVAGPQGPKGDKGDKGDSGAAETVALSSSAATKKPTVSFIFDDTCAFYLDNASVFTSRGLRFTTGLRQDFIQSTATGTGAVTWDQVKALQTAGMEISFHGMHHGYTGGKAQYVSENDVPTFLSNTDANGIKISGWVGPNGDYFEDLIFHDYGNVFKWARGGGSNGVANVGSGVDFFKKAPCHFIDDLTSDAALTTLKGKIDALVARGTGLLVLSMHWTSTQLPYIAPLLDYIISSGIDIKTVSEAYDTYGAIIEYYDSKSVIGEDMLPRKGGNGASTEVRAVPHFIVQKDGTVISNAAFKMIPKTKGSTVYNGNTLSSAYDIGVSVTQHGTTDNNTGLPGVGTLYTYNFGKNTGMEQFQLFKGYNSGGVFFRESGNDGNWKTSGFTEKLGVFRSTVPASSTASGYKGDIAADANYLYICHTNNAWIRIAKDSTWV